MSEYNREEAERELLDEVKRKHPERTTVCGAILAEMRTTRDTSLQSRLALIFALRRCRRGLNQLDRMIVNVLPSVESGEFSPERGQLFPLLFAVAMMDTPQSHSLLVSLLRNAKVPWVRADVLESMGFEGEYFDVDLVLPFASYQAHQSELLSALYTLMCQNYANKRPRKCVGLIQPFLTHPYSMVRVFAIEALSYRPSNRALILSLADDPELVVRQSVAEAVRTIDMLYED